MPEYMHLVGAEDVHSAARTIQGAAADMQRATSNFESTVFQLSQILDNFLINLREIMEQKEDH